MKTAVRGIWALWKISSDCGIRSPASLSASSDSKRAWAPKIQLMGIKTSSESAGNSPRTFEMNLSVAVAEPLPGGEDGEENAGELLDEEEPLAPVDEGDGADV